LFPILVGSKTRKNCKIKKTKTLLVGMANLSSHVLLCVTATKKTKEKFELLLLLAPMPLVSHQTKKKKKKKVSRCNNKKN